jgi:hypothetical protein
MIQWGVSRLSTVDPSPQREDIESKIIALALVVATAVSLAHAIWNFPKDDSWFFPLVFLTLLIILRGLDSTRGRVLSIAAGAPLRTYDTSAAFYAEALRAVNRSSKTIYAVFSHSTAPPQQTEESRRYYKGTLKWARKNPGQRIIQRVIRLPSSSPNIQHWVDEEVKFAETIENYYVRVLRYPPGMALEGENFAVIDSSVVFLGFAMDERQELKGFSIRDPRVAAAFEAHFRELWHIASEDATPSVDPPSSRIDK